MPSYQQRAKMSYKGKKNKEITAGIELVESLAENRDFLIIYMALVVGIF